LYNEGKGNLIHIIDNLYCAELLTDEERIQGIIDDLVKRKVLKRISPTPGYERELKKRKSQSKKEQKEAEQMLGEMGLDTDASLEQLILARRGAQQDSFLDNLEKKYSQPTKSNGAKAKSKPKTGKKK